MCRKPSSPAERIFYSKLANRTFEREINCWRKVTFANFSKLRKSANRIFEWETELLGSEQFLAKVHKSKIEPSGISVNCCGELKFELPTAINTVRDNSGVFRENGYQLSKLSLIFRTVFAKTAINWQNYQWYFGRCSSKLLSTVHNYQW